MIPQSADIEVNGPEEPFSAYLAAPEHPNGVAVVVLQEIFGVNANIRSIADDFAAAGYAAVAPDLYWRVEPGIQLDPATEQGRESAMELMKGLDRNQAVSDGAAALQALRERIPGLNRSAAVGYCFGGGVSYLMAARGVVNVGVAYYGTGLHTMLSELDGTTGRLLIHIAGDDHLCPADAQDAIVQAAAKAGGHVSVLIHSGVGHAFARVGGGGYNREAADRANAATLSLLTSLIASA